MVCELCKKNETSEGRRLCDQCLGNGKNNLESLDDFCKAASFKPGMTCDKCGTILTEKDIVDGTVRHHKLIKNLRICCWRAKRKATWKSKKSISEHKETEPTPSQPDELPEDGNVLILDFTKHVHVLTLIRERADEELRTPEHQVLWWLKSTLLESPCGGSC